MTGYEQDFIYKILPRLTNAIDGLTKEIKRYNDNKDKDNVNLKCDTSDNVKTEEEKV